MFASNLANNHPAIVPNRPKETRAEATKTTETKTEKRLTDGVDTLNKRIMDFPKDLNSLAKKMDDGFNRQDGWIKFLVGMFVTTVVLKFAYTDGKLEKKIQENVRSEVSSAESRLESRVKSKAIALESRILIELAHIKMRLSNRPTPYQDDVKAKKQ
ncbi:hypothetical protein C7212DRAFT_366249 [Tuber magnatum]|uniref:Uncharacterized protein n=1 Tax=Tuber magnatum TaxID=42249 RepID=A0A317SF91_9PEZI|nr:hypothetical protein C7212DRAFT_366249 [Tuber magnatum]